MGLFGNNSASLSRADREQLHRLEAKLDLLLAHFGLQYIEKTPFTTLSVNAQRLALDGLKIEAIKAHRQASGLGLAQAKSEVEEFMEGGR